MKMRPAVVVRKPLLKNDIQARLRRIANQRRYFGASALLDPFDLFGQLDVDCLRIELGSLCRAEPDQKNHHNGKADRPPHSHETKHASLPDRFAEIVYLLATDCRFGS